MGFITLACLYYDCACSGSTYIKIGTIQRRLAWPLRKDDTQIREAFQISLFVYVKTTKNGHIYVFVLFMYQFKTIIAGSVVDCYAIWALTAFLQVQTSPSSPALGFLHCKAIVVTTKGYCGKCRSFKNPQFFRVRCLE